MKANAEDKFLSEILPGLPSGKRLVIGPGDDCAAVRVPGKKDLLLLKTDGMAEGVHFLREEDPARVGWKALCRPLSDIGAMGGEPDQALVTIFSPKNLPLGYWKTFYRGLTRAARRFGVGVAGGEISGQAGGIAVSVALTGWVPARRMVCRSGGRPGDWLLVTGRLGGSIRGHHLDFLPRVREGRWLSEHFKPKAMMDVSDGLGADLPRLARASGCGFEVDLRSIPCRRGSGVSDALSDGEDYELVMAISPGTIARLMDSWKRAFPRVPLTCIGRLNGSGEAPSGWPGGWDHFSIARE